MPANPHRATVVLALGNPPLEHDVCLSNQALAELEAELDIDLPQIEYSKLGIRKAIAIIHAGLRGAGKKVDRPAVLALLDPMKPGDVITAAIKALTAAFTDPEPTANPQQEGASPSA